MSHDQKKASDWTRQDPVTEQLAVRDFTRPSFSQRLKGVACETTHRCGHIPTHAWLLCVCTIFVSWIYPSAEEREVEDILSKVDDTTFNGKCTVSWCL